MGCCNSTEGAVISEGSSEPAAGQQNVRSTGIPTIPGWDGVGVATVPVAVQFEMKGGWGSITTSIEPLLNTIMAQNIAGAGYNLAAVFLPVISQGKQKGQPMDMEAAGWRTVLAKAMCIFQMDLHYSPMPQETLFLKAAMNIKVKHFSFDAISVEGYEGLYNQLGQAGKYQITILLYIKYITRIKFARSETIFVFPDSNISLLFLGFYVHFLYMYIPVTFPE